MSYKNFIRHGVISLGVAALLTACGGGSNSSSNTTGTSSSTTGAITAFGSVFVNGKEIETGNASIYMEGKPAKESDLRVGMVVTVKEGNNGEASCINFDDELEGIVVSNSIVAPATTGSMNIMGQVVNIDANTIFESYVASITTYSDITPGNIVEVSGYSAGTGEVSATRIEVKADSLASYSGDVELKGVVSNHNATALTFDIGTLSVDYSGAVLDDITAITDGMYVEVKSTSGLVSGVLIASKVEHEDGGACKTQKDEDDEFEVHGKVVAVTETSLTVDDYTFILDDKTEFEDGNKAAVKVGTMVEVEGYYNAENVLVAKKVEVEEHSSVSEFKGSIESVTSTGANEGTIKLTSGETFIVNSKTIMHDDSTSDIKQFNLTYLSQGDNVEIYAIDNGDGTYTAIKLERN